MFAVDFREKEQPSGRANFCRELKAKLRAVRWNRVVGFSGQSDAAVVMKTRTRCCVCG